MNNELLHDIKMALKVIKSNKNENVFFKLKEELIGECNNNFSKYSQVYLFSNENLRDYYKLFDFKGKNVLTVAGSGDQVFSSILYGSKFVDCFDINKLTYYNIGLKMACIKSLEYNEFLAFYSFRQDFSYLEQLYSQVSLNFCSKKMKCFWDNIIDIFFENLKYFYLDNNLDLDLVKRRIPYLDKENYYKLKNLINNIIKFKNTDVFGLNNINKKYDFINFSNIFYYVDEKNYIEFLKNIYRNNLNEDGFLVFNYFWDNYKLDVNDYLLLKDLNFIEYDINDLAVHRKKEKGKVLIMKK